MTFSVLVALALIGIAIVGFVAFVVTLIVTARNYGNLHGGKTTDHDASKCIVADADDRNPYAPTHAYTGGRPKSFGRIAFAVFIAFAVLLAALLMVSGAVLVLRWVRG